MIAAQGGVVIREAASTNGIARPAHMINRHGSSSLSERRLSRPRDLATKAMPRPVGMSHKPEMGEYPWAARPSPTLMR